MKEVVIVDGIRTPIGVFGGALRSLTAQDLGVVVTKSLLERTKLDPATIDEVIWGCIAQGSDAPNIARVIALRAGIPEHVTNYTVQRNCASGMQSIVNAFQAIQMGEGEIYLAGGTESMSNIPYVSRDMRWGKRIRHSTFIDGMWEGLNDPVVDQMMGQTAENLAEEFGISREAQDKFTVESHKRAFKATRMGKLKDEIVPVTVPKKVAGKEVEPDIVSEDEGINVALSAQTLAMYPTIFKEVGTVTPGNACGTNDGASLCLVMSRERAEALGYTPLCRVVSYAFAGCSPARMGIGPALAAPRAIEKAGLSKDDVDLWEINEAFAAQILSVEKVLEIDHKNVNVNGGALALGHPVGMSGNRIILTLAHELKRQNKKIGVAALCIGGGQGGAVVIERI
jgi:acetyl-CoA C-acetyltransferase